MRSRIGLTLLCLTSLGFATPALGASRPLQLEEVLDSVDRHFPEILKAQAEFEEQKAKARATLGPFDPKLSVEWGEHRDGYPSNELLGAKLSTQIPGTGVSAEFGWDRTLGDFPVYEGDRQTGSEGRWKGGLTVPLLRDLITDGSRTKRNVESLKANEKGESARLVRLQTYLKAALTYWDWLARVETQKIMVDLLKLAEQRDEILSKRVKRGDAPAIDVVDNQRIILQRRSQLLKSQQETLNANLDLSLFLRDEAQQLVRPDEARAPLWLDEKRVQNSSELKNVDAVVARYPDIKKLQFEIGQLDANRRLNSQSLLPRLDLKLESARYEGELPTFRKDENELFVGVQFSIPLLNAQARGNRDSANLELNAKKLELTLKEQKLKVELTQLASEVRTAKEIFLVNFAEIRAADRMAFAERKKFERGDSNLFLVNAREMDAAVTRKKAINSLYEYHEKDLKLKLMQTL